MDSELAVCLADITKRLDALAGLPAQVGEIKDSIQLLSQKYDHILSRQVKQEKDISSLNRRVGKLEVDCTSADIQQLKATVNDLEFRSRRLNIEVHGIQATPNEDLLSKLNDVAKITNLPELTANDIGAIHRLPSKPNRTPGIIVRFAQQSIRDKWLGKRKALRDASSGFYGLRSRNNRATNLCATDTRSDQTHVGHDNFWTSSDTGRFREKSLTCKPSCLICKLASSTMN
ncbi:hypothetical protein HPB50_025004 [Hyalomma asiaticum]|uniref:Uncharacterized protein n=1 Tax=Hyalomma asiaticum TaxID=266040 RepID=A0ACB7T1V0_HYAAI|nr:hypothetical protein HPB50_025004 [Hyalomma asiaticum]